MKKTNVSDVVIKLFDLEEFSMIFYIVHQTAARKKYFQDYLLD